MTNYKNTRLPPWVSSYLKWVVGVRYQKDDCKAACLCGPQTIVVGHIPTIVGHAPTGALVSQRNG